MDNYSARLNYNWLVGSIWSILFAIYLIVTLFYFYWTTTLEEEFLTEKYGDSYRKYLKKTPRYLGLPRR